MISLSRNSPDLPQIPSNIDPDVKAYLEKIHQMIYLLFNEGRPDESRQALALGNLATANKNNISPDVWISNSGEVTQAPFSAVDGRGGGVVFSSALAEWQLYSYGSPFSGFSSGIRGVVAGGTLASPTQTTNAHSLYFSMDGYTGSAYIGATALIRMKATASFTSSSCPTEIEFSVTRSGSVTNEVAFNIGPDFCRLSGTSPYSEIFESDATTDEKNWRFSSASGLFALLAINDARSGGSNAYTVDRNGTTVTDHIFYSGGSARLTINSTTVNAADSYSVGGTKVVGLRDTGWTAGTGTPNKGAFAASTAAEQRILAIEQALRAHGLIN